MHICRRQSTTLPLWSVWNIQQHMLQHKAHSFWGILQWKEIPDEGHPMNRSVHSQMHHACWPVWFYFSNNPFSGLFLHGTECPHFSPSLWAGDELGIPQWALRAQNKFLHWSVSWWMGVVKCTLKPGVCARCWGPQLAPACCAMRLPEPSKVCAARNILQAMGKTGRRLGLIILKLT